LLFNDLLVFGTSTGRRGSFKSGASAEKFKLKFRVPLCDCILIDGLKVINSEQTRLLSELPPLISLAEVKRRRSSVGDTSKALSMEMLARAAAAEVNHDDEGGGDLDDLEDGGGGGGGKELDLELVAAMRAAEMVASVSRQEEAYKKAELECKSWKSILDTGITLDKLKSMSEDVSFVIATPIKTLVLSAPNK
jgi:hypothetical protein